MWFFGLIVVVLIGAVAVVASGRWGAMSTAYDDRPDMTVPARQVLTSTDIESARFAVGLRGYRMDEVDTLLERVAKEVAERDRRIADLERAVAPIVDAPDGAGFMSRGTYDPAEFDDTGVQEPILVGGDFPPVPPLPVAEAPVAVPAAAEAPVVAEVVADEGDEQDTAEVPRTSSATTTDEYERLQAEARALLEAQSQPVAPRRKPAERQQPTIPSAPPQQPEAQSQQAPPPPEPQPAPQQQQQSEQQPLPEQSQQQSLPQYQSQPQLQQPAATPAETQPAPQQLQRPPHRPEHAGQPAPQESLEQSQPVHRPTHAAQKPERVAGQPERPAQQPERTVEQSEGSTGQSEWVGETAEPVRSSGSVGAQPAPTPHWVLPEPVPQRQQQTAADGQPAAQQPQSAAQQAESDDNQDGWQFWPPADQQPGASGEGASQRPN